MGKYLTYCYVKFSFLIGELAQLTKTELAQLRFV